MYAKSTIMNTSNQERCLMWIPDKPYNDLPSLPPATDVETPAILKACITASRHLAALHASADLIPNQHILTNTLPLMEAQASSEIENIVTTADELFRYAAVENTDSLSPAMKEAFGYRKAMRQGFDLLATRPLCTNTAVDLCRILRHTDAGIRSTPGCCLRNQSTGRVVYTPPEGEPLIREKLANWERFMNGRADIDPLIRLAVGHYQFEAIHPFSDGNGRTGRILNILFLVQERLLSSPVLYLSRAIIRDKAAYYSRLNAVTANGEWEPFILYMVNAVGDTAAWTHRRITLVRQLLGETAAFMRERLGAAYSRELADLLFVWPYCRITNLVDAGIAQRQTATRYLDALAEAGILDTARQGKTKLFVNKRLLALLLTDTEVWQPFK